MSEEKLVLGRFELCLNVKDIHKSLEFYRKLGFSETQGDVDKGWAIIRHGNCILGLYQGHIGNNAMNFRGGEVFKIAEVLKSKGLTFEIDAHKEADESDGAVLKDPDGNVIYFNTAPGEEI